MNRRSFLVTASSLMLAQAIAGCGRLRANTAGLRVSLLEGSVPGQLLHEFQRRVEGGAGSNFLPKEQLAELFTLLETFQKQQGKTKISDWVTLGDYWLTNAIQQGLIQPLNLENVEGWQSFGNAEVWQSLLRRDRQGQPSATGELWAAPYRWGTLMIAYRADVFKQKGLTLPTDWSDLWRPELQRQISLLDSPRSVIGLTLKKLGQSINTENLEDVSDLETNLKALQQQVKVYSSDAYLQPLDLGDTWVAVGWSTELLPMIEDDRNLAGVVPRSGTILTADLWVNPVAAPGLNATSESSNPLQAWLAFCWQDQIATQLSLLSSAASPIFWGRDQSQMPRTLQSKPLIFPAVEVLEKSEFLLPLSASATEQYRRLWVEVRQG